MIKRKENSLKKDIIYILKNEDSNFVINENYFYKTESYYTILQNENESIRIIPSSSEVLDAYIVPICLEKARLSGIPVCDWIISYQYVSLPAIIYGMNYFSTPSNFFLVSDIGEAKKAVKHVTNRGRYPFCYQKISESASVIKYVSIFGKTMKSDEQLCSLASMVYEIFRLPLVEIILIKDKSGYRLSSLAPVKYSQLSNDEAKLLQIPEKVVR